MATAKLTKTSVVSLTCPPGKAEEYYWDEGQPGFGLRTFKSGRAVWVCQYRNPEGRTRKMTLGDLKTVDVAKARQRAKDLLADAQLGGDPQEDARALRHGDTVKDVISDYLKAKEKKLKPRSYVEVDRALSRTAKSLHPLKISAVTRATIVGLLDRVERDHGPFAANRTRANLSGLWTWAIKSGRTEPANPVAATFAPTKEKSRDRVLTDDELRLIWKCTAGDHDYDRIVRLLMLTAARRDEIGAMEWSELNNPSPDQTLWVLPAARTKNASGQELPLSPLAVAQLPPRREGSSLLFGARATAFSGWSKCKTRLDARMVAAKAAEFTKARGREPSEAECRVDGWRLHDLRRTFATWASNAGHPPHIVEAVLNHVSGSAKRGVAGVYNRAVYRGPKGEVLKEWAAHIEGLGV
jgi:integrase